MPLGMATATVKVSLGATGRFAVKRQASRPLAEVLAKSTGDSCEPRAPIQARQSVKAAPYGGMTRQLAFGTGRRPAWWELVTFQVSSSWPSKKPICWVIS